MGRQSNARERLLGAACELMEGRGYTGIGVAEICARADVRKGSFYHFFPSKQALTIAAIDAHWQEQRAHWAGTLQGEGTPLDRLEALFRSQVAAQQSAKDAAGTVNGCLFGNLALELSNQESEVQARLQEIFAEQIDLVRGTLDEASREGAIPESSASVASARSVVAQLEGMVLFAKLGNDPAVLADLWPQTLLLLRAVHPAPAA
jgi:TetR/AcrR family transcriptional repressor of nem operon